MRIARLNDGTPVLGNGPRFNPKTSSLVSLIAQIDAGPSDPVNASMSVIGEVNGFTPEAITFSGASIISFSGTGTAQWTGQIENNGYESIYFQLGAVSAISFRTAATEEDA